MRPETKWTALNRSCDLKSRWNWWNCGRQKLVQSFGMFESATPCFRLTIALFARSKYTLNGVQSSNYVQCVLAQLFVYFSVAFSFVLVILVHIHPTNSVQSENTEF
jgi:hypothetical protein